MTGIALIITPLFVLITLGFISVKSGLVKSEALSSLGNIILYFAMPAVIISSVAQTRIDEFLNPWFILTYALASLLLLGFGLITNRFLLKGDLSHGAIQGMGMSSPNSMFIGFPLLVLLFPDNPPTAAFAMAVLVENLLTIPLALILLEVAASRDEVNSKLSGARIRNTIFLRLLKNPLLLSIMAGVVISSFNIGFPTPLAKTLQMLSQMTAALALFFIGITLASNQLQRVSGAVGLTVFGKLILHPAMTALFIILLPDFDPVLQAAAVILTASPMITIYPILGERYGHRQFCVNTLMLSMILAFFTLVVVLNSVQILRG